MRPFRYWASCSPELRLWFEPRSTQLDRRDALASEDAIVRDLWLQPFPSEASTYRKDFGDIGPRYFERPIDFARLDGTGFDERVRVELMRTNCHPQLYWLVQMAWSGVAVFEGIYQQLRAQPERVPVADRRARNDELSKMLAGIARLKEEVALVLENVERHILVFSLIGEPWEVVHAYAAAYSPFSRRLFWETYEAGTMLRDSILVAVRERLQSRLEMLVRRDYPASLQIDDPEVTTEQLEQVSTHAKVLLVGLEHPVNSKFFDAIDAETNELLTRAFGKEVGQPVGQRYFLRVFGEFLYSVHGGTRSGEVHLSEGEKLAFDQLHKLVYELFLESS